MGLKHSSFLCVNMEHLWEQMFVQTMQTKIEKIPILKSLNWDGQGWEIKDQILLGHFKIVFTVATGDNQVCLLFQDNDLNW